MYSFAFVILEVLSDKKVRPAETMVDAARKAFDEKADLSASALNIELPEKIEDILARAVKVDKTLRPPDMHALWGQIKRVVKEEGIKVRVPATYNGPESAPSMVTQVGPGSPGFMLPGGMHPLMGSPLGSPLGPAEPNPVQVIVNDPPSSPEMESIPLTRRHSSRPPAGPVAEPTVPLGSLASPAPAPRLNGGPARDRQTPPPPSPPAPAARARAAPEAPAPDTFQPADASETRPSQRPRTSSRPPPKPRQVMLTAFLVTVVLLVAGLVLLARLDH